MYVITEKLLLSHHIPRSLLFKVTLGSWAILGGERRQLKTKLTVMLSSYPFTDVNRESVIGFSRHWLLVITLQCWGQVPGHFSYL